MLGCLGWVIVGLVGAVFLGLWGIFGVNLLWVVDFLGDLVALWGCACV